MKGDSENDLNIDSGPIFDSMNKLPGGTKSDFYSGFPWIAAIGAIFCFSVGYLFGSQDFKIYAWVCVYGTIAGMLLNWLS